ncbi:MAG TPA: hypothetical protein VFS56_11935 [Gemmatimonadaceae bacterium]|nr:hypothetical protein [Gemmatimonadaceae bacterium]
MTFLFPLLLLPIVYLVVLGNLAFRKSTRGIGISILFFAVTFGAGYWAITQSRSSTAALGFLWLPFVSAIVGFLGLAFWRWTRGTADATPRRVFGWLALAAAIVIVAVNMREGLRTRRRNIVREGSYAAQLAEITRNRALIAREIALNPGRERAYIDSSIRARTNDRAFLLAALNSDSISPGILDSLAGSPDRGIALEAVRNSGTRAETLRRVYEQKDYPDYFFQALAGNPNTPADILRRLSRDPGVISNLDIWLAGNPATPRDVLEHISRRTRDQSVIRRLLTSPNENFDCALLIMLDSSLKRLVPLDQPSMDQAVARAIEGC